MFSHLANTLAATVKRSQSWNRALCCRPSRTQHCPGSWPRMCPQSRSSCGTSSTCRRWTAPAKSVLNSMQVSNLDPWNEAIPYISTDVFGVHCCSELPGAVVQPVAEVSRAVQHVAGASRGHVAGTHWRWEDLYRQAACRFPQQVLRRLLRPKELPCCLH